MKFLDHLEEWLITFLIGGATLIIFTAVMHRYAAGVPIPVVQDWLLSLNPVSYTHLDVYKRQLHADVPEPRRIAAGRKRDRG